MKQQNEEIDSLVRAYDHLHFTPAQKERIAQQLSSASARARETSGRNQTMGVLKNWNFKKTAAAAAVVLLASGGAAYAAGRVSTLVADSGPMDYVSDYAAVSEKSEDAGVDATVPEAFSNGYVFESVASIGTDALDEDGRKVDDWKELEVIYTNEAGDQLWLSAQSATHAIEGSAEATMTRTIDGIEVCYDYDEYLFLPANYEAEGLPDDATRQRMETDPHFYVSYGTDEVQTKYFTNTSFVKDGVYYLLYAMDTDLTADDFFEMSAELISQ